MSLFWLYISFFIVVCPLLEGKQIKKTIYTEDHFTLRDEIILREYDSSLLLRKKRIVGSRLVKRFAAVFVASVQRITNKEHLCMATLITTKTLITSCSCVMYVAGNYKEIPIFQPTYYMVVAGIKNLQLATDGDSRIVSKFFRDPHCRHSEEMKIWTNDRGYIELQWPFHKSDSLNVVTFPKSQSRYNGLYNVIYNNTDFAEGGQNFCITYGWGARTFDSSLSLEGNNSKHLGQIHVQLLTNSKCDERFKEISIESTLEKTGMFCASGVSKNRLQKGLLCSKDQGAPLICNDLLVAIGTPVTHCGYAQQLGIFQKLQITQLLDFSTLDIVVNGKPSKHKLFVFLLTLPSFIIFKNHCQFE